MSCFWLHVVVAVVVVGHFTHIIQLVPPQTTFLWPHLLSAACISKISSTGKKKSGREREREIIEVSRRTHHLAFQIPVQTHTRGTKLARSRAITDVENLLKFAVI